MQMVSIVIQAGGKSSRMGRDKSFLMIRGKPLIELIIEKVSVLGNDLIITSNEPSKFADFNANVVQDEYKGVGGLAGLHTGIKAAKNDIVVVVANDMPFINLDLLVYMCNLISSKVDIVIPYSMRGYEPFHAIYRKSTCLPAIENAILNQEKRIISWFDAVHVRKIEGSELINIDPEGLAFMNINTPEEWVLVEKLYN
ncbi:MAG: molybdenum cofactor guanylyltransferase [Anaerolineaceae bacterium]